jgi:hypothetical protein
MLEELLERYEELAGENAAALRMKLKIGSSFIDDDLSEDADIPF